MNLRNKANKNTGKFLCGGSVEQRLKTRKGCGTEVAVGQLENGVLYCLKCVKEMEDDKSH